MTDPQVERLGQQMSNFGSLMECLMKKFEETYATVDSFASRSMGDGQGLGLRNRNKRNYREGTTWPYPNWPSWIFQGTMAWTI